MNGNVSRYDTQTIRKLVALSVAMMCVIAIVPNDLASDGIDWFVSNEPSMSVPPTIEENDTGSDKADSTPSIEAGNTTTNETPEIPETNGSTAEITDTTEDDLPAEIPPVEEGIENEGETIPEDGEDFVDEPSSPDKSLEHFGGTGGMVAGINFIYDGKVIYTAQPVFDELDLFFGFTYYDISSNYLNNYIPVKIIDEYGEKPLTTWNYSITYHLDEVVQVILE